MKKMMLLSVLATVLLMSCGGDDPAPKPTPEYSIVGVWKQIKYQFLSGKDTNIILEEYVERTACEQKSTCEFTADNKYITKIFIDDKDGKCIEDGSDITSYTYDKKTKKLKLGNEKMKGDVIELTENTLVLQANEERDFNKDGVDDYIKMYFIRKK